MMDGGGEEEGSSLNFPASLAPTLVPQTVQGQRESQ